MAQRGRSDRAAILAQVVALAGVYFAAGKFGLSLAFVHESATAVWPPTGIALAALLVLGYAVWPGILLGAFLVNVTTAGTVATSMGIAAGNTLEGVLGAYLINRFAGGRRVFDRPQDVLKFVVLAGVLSTSVSATLGVSSLCLGGTASWADYGSIWFTWWLGDAGGALVVAPLLVLWSKSPPPQWSRARALEAAVLFLSLFLVGLVLFRGLVPAIAAYPLSFASVPFLIWPAFRLGQRATVTGSFILSGIAIWGTLRGTGPFLRETPNESLLLLQGFLDVTTVTALLLAAVVLEQRRAQEALARHATELERSNAELEQFAYVASHDLQEPLRMVTSFVQLLARRYQDRLDADAHEFIRFAVEGTARMRALIEGLLAFSRAGAAKEPLKATDCGRVLDRAVANLSLSIEESGALVTRDAMPVAMGDELQLVQVFENLIGNAIKFRSRRTPEVHLGARRKGREWVVSVRDNGIGIQRNHWERIFIIFQRLHGRDEYPGAGIGLAICKKIIARHGGRIWVDSRPGEGTTFYFTLLAAREKG